MRQYKNPQALVARLANLYAKRRELQTQVDELHAEERALLDQALALFTAQNLPSCEVSGAKVRIGTQPIATIQDWHTLTQAVTDCARAHGPGEARDRFLSVIHKRVSPTALEKLSFDKILLPGVLLEHKKVALFTAAREKKE
jgi:hypothetical protein